MITRAWLALRLMALALVAGCSAGPPAIAWGTDNCDFCRMTITDERYAAAAITATGRTVRFDAIECLAGWVAAQEKPPRSLWVTDISHPGGLIPVAEAHFYRGTGSHSPMGGGLVATAAGTDSSGTGAALGAGPLSWEDVRELVRQEGALPDSALRGGR